MRTHRYTFFLRGFSLFFRQNIHRYILRRMANFAECFCARETLRCTSSSFAASKYHKRLHHSGVSVESPPEILLSMRSLSSKSPGPSSHAPVAPTPRAPPPVSQTPPPRPATLPLPRVSSSLRKRATAFSHAHTRSHSLSRSGSPALNILAVAASSPTSAGSGRFGSSRSESVDRSSGEIIVTTHLFSFLWVWSSIPITLL